MLCGIFGTNMKNNTNHNYSDCRTNEGITIGLIDSIIIISRVLSKMDLFGDSVNQALKDLRNDEDVKKIMNNEKVLYDMTLEDVENFIVESYLRRSSQWDMDYMYYTNIVSGSFDVIESHEQHKKDHEFIRSVLENMVNRGIFDKKEGKFKLIKHD
jgi:hypothetical protein